MQRSSKPLVVRLSETAAMAGCLPSGFYGDNAADVGSMARRSLLLNLFSRHRLKRAGEMNCAARRGTGFFPKQSVSLPASFFPLRVQVPVDVFFCPLRSLDVRTCERGTRAVGPSLLHRAAHA